jgi:probable rRNA maturation factor
VTNESWRSSAWRRERGERHNISVDVSYTVRRKPISVRRARDAVIATLRAERVKDALISVAFVGSNMMAQLNEQFLNSEGPTDVITFGLSPRGGKMPVIGDIYICPPVAQRNAKRLGVSESEEFLRLLVHGTLHILGYDHPEDETRTASPMWKRQERILDSLD